MTTQMLEFKAEVKQLLDLMIHSLYTHKEVFLRELVSNASDAIDKARYESLTNPELLQHDTEWKIRLSVDKAAGTLTVSDNGIGMTRDEAIEELGTIARSGTGEFLRSLREKKAEGDHPLIGQFGVGFYSSFMVADRVTVISRKAGLSPDKGVKWESSAKGSFTVEDAEKERRGTDVILHLRKEDERFLDEFEIRRIIKRYSDYIEHPIVMEIERQEESGLAKGQKVTVREDEVLNSRKALWLKDKSEVSDEEYHEFYRHVSHDFGQPSQIIHYKAEGTSEFSALLFIPDKMPLGIFYKDYRIGPALYVNRVQIMDHCEELLPPYLRFVKGVIDSSDLPLNVSRETLQHNRQAEIIRKNVTKKVLDTLQDMMDKDYARYVDFYREFGRILKEGVHYDYSRREAIADLLLLPSTKTGSSGFTTFKAYLDGMKQEQQEIYYITAATFDEAAASPYLEVFREKDYEVLVMLDEIDDIILTSLAEYGGKKLKSVIKGEIAIDKSAEDVQREARDKYEKMLGLFKERLKDHVGDVRFSGRLKDSPCCLVAEEGAPDATTEKILRALGQDLPVQKKILELNPSHPLLERMHGFFLKDSAGDLVGQYIDLLYDQALILEGSRPRDPSAFAAALSRLMLDASDHETRERSS